MAIFNSYVSHYQRVLVSNFSWIIFFSPGARDHGVAQHGEDGGRSFHGKSGALGRRGVDGWFQASYVENVRSKLLKFTVGIW